MASKNEHTGDVLQSRMNSKEFEENFDRIFRSHLKEYKETHEKLARIDTIGSNGNTGDHYEYELNKSTGDVEKRFIDGVSKPNGEQFGNESDSTES
jgi:hypothetical protein